MAKKKITVLEFLNLTSVASDDIPVTVKEGLNIVCTAKSLRWLMSHGMPYELEANIKEIKICNDNILIYIQPKPYSSKV
ncbi:MAG: hypothetical protein UHK60_09300 [Acutalibacteraceae bacterium]|nr:hypothetical protein [Acutalibacteraceae bacterium]